MLLRDDDGRTRAAMGGDPGAFASIFERYAPMVHGVLLARVTRAEADDLVQDVFETAMRKIHTLRDPDKVGAWLAQIARNRALDARRNAKRTEPLEDDDHESTSGTPSQRAEASRVLAIIQELPEAYRETLVLRLVEGMTGPEIAEQVGLTADSVRVNLHRGMKLLKERLGLSGQEERDR